MEEIKDAAQEKAFFAIDGSVYKNVKDMSDSFDRMSDDTFYYHVGESRNDFAAWARDVLNSHSLADELSRSKCRLESQVAVLKHMLKNNQ